MCLTLVLSIAGTASGGDGASGDGASKDSAKEIFDKGVELFNKNDYVGALAEFMAAYKEKPHYTVLYNIAQCFALAENNSQALYYYNLYLEEGADYLTQTRKQLVLEQIQKLKETLCPLKFDITPVDADLILDGKEIGKVSEQETVFLDPGEHTLIVQKPGHAAGNPLGSRAW